MTRSSGGILSLVVLAFGAGFMTHALYKRRNPIIPQIQDSPPFAQSTSLPAVDGPNFRVTFVPSPPNPMAEASAAELVPIVARDVEKIRS